VCCVPHQLSLIGAEIAARLTPLSIVPKMIGRAGATSAPIFPRKGVGAIFFGGAVFWRHPSSLRAEQAQENPKSRDDNRHSKDGGEDSILHFLPNHDFRLWKSRVGKSHLMV
jgi:hypothetical protein